MGEAVDQHHIVARARERYGLELSRDDIERVRRAIRGTHIDHSVKAHYVGPACNGAEYWSVNFKGTTMDAIWLPRVLSIATFLPRPAALRSTPQDKGEK